MRETEPDTCRTRMVKCCLPRFEFFHLALGVEIRVLNHRLCGRSCTFQPELTEVALLVGLQL
jgi:hypothetical protein